MSHCWTSVWQGLSSHLLWQVRNLLNIAFFSLSFDTIIYNNCKLYMYSGACTSKDVLYIWCFEWVAQVTWIFLCATVFVLVMVEGDRILCRGRESGGEGGGGGESYVHVGNREIWKVCVLSRVYFWQLSPKSTCRYPLYTQTQYQVHQLISSHFLTTTN